MPGHEVYDLGSDLLGGTDEIALILAVFVVNDDDHAAVADLGDGFVNSRNRHEGMLTESVAATKRQAAKVRRRKEPAITALCVLRQILGRGGVRRTWRLRPLRGLRRRPVSGGKGWLLPRSLE